MSKPLYRSYQGFSDTYTSNSYPTYMRMTRLIGGLPPLSHNKKFDPRVDHMGVPYFQPNSKYLRAGLRSGNPNLVSTWKGNPIYM